MPARSTFWRLACRQHTNQYVWQQSQRQEGFNNVLNNMKIHRISGPLAHVYEKLEKQSFWPVSVSPQNFVNPPLSLRNLKCLDCRFA